MEFSDRLLCLGLQSQEVSGQKPMIGGLGFFFLFFFFFKENKGIKLSINRGFW